MNNKEQQRRVVHEVLVILGILALLTFICRLWPILLLIFLAIIIAALRLVFLSSRKVEVIPPLPLLEAPSKEPTEKDVRDLAYSVIQKKITELVSVDYPDARWVWEQPNSKEKIEKNEPVYILLSRAGGYRRAQVHILNLQVTAIKYDAVEDKKEGQEEFDISENENTKLKRYTKRDKGNKYILDKYGKSKRLKEWRGFPLVPISYVQTKAPLLMRVTVNQYTPEGRAAVHKNLSGIDLNVLYYLMRNPVQGESIEYNDNRLSLFCGQYGKCAITGKELTIGDIHCHHIIHRANGGTDRYENLMLVTKDVHLLLHASNIDTVQKLLAKLKLSGKEKAKLNYYRERAGLMGI